MPEQPLGPDQFLGAINVNSLQVVALESIPAGSAVYISGTTSTGVPLIKRANASSKATAATHVVVNAFTRARSGWAFKRTPLRAFDTQGHGTSTPLYLSASVPGALTFTPPAAPAIVQLIARVTQPGASGELMVDVGSTFDGGTVPGDVHAVVVDGNSPNTDIPIAGLLATDSLLLVGRLRIATLFNDETANFSITAPGVIQGTNDTLNDFLLVVWARRALAEADVL